MVSLTGVDFKDVDIYPVLPNWGAMEKFLNTKSPQTFFLEGQVLGTFVFLILTYLCRPRAPLHFSGTITEYGPFNEGEKTGSSQPQLSRSQGIEQTKHIQA